MNKLSNIICFKCGKIGHKAYACLSNKIVSTNVKKIWISKGTIMTNLKGPKLVWVLKVKTWFYVYKCVLHPKQWNESSILIADA